MKKYAAALGHEAQSCPPNVYHQLDDAVRGKFCDAADADLQPRSVQAGVNAVLKLLHRAVDEGCLPSLQPALVRRGSLRCKRSLRSYIRGDERAAWCHGARYGLTAWPLDLAYETAMYKPRQNIIYLRGE